jgi:hypothetical protein
MEKNLLIFISIVLLNSVPTYADNESGLPALPTASEIQVEEAGSDSSKSLWQKFKEYFDVIEGNDKLLNYLQLLTEYVNANPGILNRDYNGKTMESEGLISTSDAAQKIGVKMQIIPSNKYNGLIDYKKLKSMLSSYDPPIMEPNYNSPFVFHQFGGQLVSTSDSIDVIKNYTIIRAHITIMEVLLKEKGILLDDITKNLIDSKYHTLARVNNELFNIYIYLDAYKKFQELFGDRNQEIVTISNIEKLVEKKNLLRATQKTEEISLVDILGSLQSLMINESNNDENKP